MADISLTAPDASKFLARGQACYDHYRGQGNLDRNGQVRRPATFDEQPRRKSQKQLEREIVGDSIRLSWRKAWSPGNSKSGAQAIKREPRLAVGSSRELKVATAGGMTTINFRVASLSRTSKRHSVSESWHSATHAKYLERMEAVAGLQSDPSPASASDYIERDSAIAAPDDEAKALYSNISTDPAERHRFWQLVEACEPEGGHNELTIDMSMSGSLARAVAGDADCPEELGRMIEQASPDETIKLTGGDHVALRAIFLRQGWSAPKRGKRRSKKANSGVDGDASAGTHGSKFQDARAGRTQIQANGEIPAELSLAGKARITKRLHDWFDQRALPVTVVLHEPDHKNNEKNWHFHFAAYDRPCRRFDNRSDWLLDLQGDATDADIKARAKAERVIGHQDLDQHNQQWDFAVPWREPTKSRNMRESFHFRQNKDRSINDDEFIETMRKLLVDLCNDELQREGFQPRYDHRTYKLMGIPKEPDEHLDKNAAQLEKFGVPTKKGVANEMRQWAFVMAGLDRELAEGLVRVDVVHRKHSALAEAADATNIEKARQAVDQWRALVISAQTLFRSERELEQLIERAKSRAVATAQACRKQIDAIDSGKTGRGEVKNRELYTDRLRLADDHLAGVDLHFQQQVLDIESLRLHRFKSMELANQARRNIIVASRSTSGAEVARSFVADKSRNLSSIEFEPAAQRQAVLNPIEQMICAFRSAKTDHDRYKAAASIRATPQALQAMNQAGDALWKVEQQRFAKFQQAGRAGHGEQGY